MFDPEACQTTIRFSDRSEQSIRRAVVASGGRCGRVEVTHGGHRWLVVFDAGDKGKAMILDRVYLGQGERASTGG